MKIQVVVTGRSYHTAENVPSEVELPDSATVDDAIAALSQHLTEGSEFPTSCLIAISGTHLGTLNSHENRVLCDGDELTLIAPVAGG